MRKIKRITLFTVLSIVSATMLRAQQRSSIADHLALMDSIYTRVMKSYVEKPAEKRLYRAAIDASLNTLDPYSNYMDAQEAEDFYFSMKAKFGGVGLVMTSMNDVVYTKEIFKGYPADQNGIKPGDALVQIDSILLKGKALNDVFPLLRGTPGSMVAITLFRPSANRTFKVNITRETIVLPSVPYYGFLSTGVGYIKITSENEQTFDEVKKALLELKNSGNLKGLVLDLRGNIGGLMSQAIKVANLFLEKGKVAVSEKSWYGDTTHYFSEEPVDTKIPIVVLVDNQTASSGEILTGALQDHDRAILIGEKTFGKGMVQRMFNLPHGERLKLTTAFYYTPGGRCIQRKEKGGQRTMGWDDSLKKVVYTANGRPVVSFDGISPDIPLTKPTQPTVINDLLQWNDTRLFRFANQYMVSHPKIAPAKSFRVTDAEYESFIRFLKKENFILTSPAEKEIDDLEKSLLAEGYNDLVKTEVVNIRKRLSAEKLKQYVSFKNEIRNLLESEIAGQYYYNGGRLENSLKNDKWVIKAIEVLLNWERYKNKLQPPKN
jgi:carboxyl-terminal processing protease